MAVDRRKFLLTTGLSVAGSALANAASAAPEAAGGLTDWDAVRAQFAVDPQYAHFAAFFLSTHPRPVREEVERLRRELDANPFLFVEHGMFHKPDEVRASAAEYLGVPAEEVALNRATTEGLAMVYSGLRLPAGSEILVTTHDHYSHHESVRLAALRTGSKVRQVALYDRGAEANAEECVARLKAAIRPETQVVGATWVHSSTGVKLPIRELAAVVAAANRGRGDEDRILLVVDGVHGFGAVDETVGEMGCDFFCAGTHKWIFAPRGTGLVWGRKEAWARLEPTVPAFELGPYEAWLARRTPGPTRAAWMSPGGFHAYEHMWAVPAAFEFHKAIGRARISARINELNHQIKEGLAGMSHVTLHTPRGRDMSAGIVSFEVAGLTEGEVVERLLEKKILASTSPYNPSYARLSGSLLNTPGEVETALDAVAGLA